MEEYIREAPRTDNVPNKTIEYRQIDFVPYQEEEPSPPISEPFEEPVMKEILPEPAEDPQFGAEEEDEPETPTADLLGLHEVNPAIAALEESNALALAIVPPGGGPNTPAIGFGEITGSSGWELALVTAQTATSSSQLTESKLAGGFDKLLLDSLYDDAARRQQTATDAYGNAVDPFAMSNGVAPPTGVQMSMMVQQQAMLGMPQQFQSPYSNGAAGSQFNPFGDAYSAVPFQSAPLHGSSSLI